jgi:hypothetical protein
MNAIKKARRIIEADPNSPAAKTLASLVLALESAEPVVLEDVYRLDSQNFDLAIQVLREWRLDRYYMGKAKLFDVSWHAREICAGGSDIKMSR